MKTFFAIALFSLCLLGCRLEYNKSVVQPPQNISASLVQVQDTTGALVFKKDILPILKEKCSPCHFEGGKMYQRMPFDNPKTILDHKEGVLRRFKDPELVSIKRYLEESSK